MRFTPIRLNSCFLSKNDTATANRKPAKMHQLPVIRGSIN
jgi:hypothetical protein